MRTPHRRIRNKLEAGERVFGVSVQLPSPEVAEIVGYAGLDFVWIDAEHGTLDLGDISQIVRGADASGIDAIVRVPDQSLSFIQRVLDLGAAGIVAPHVRTVTEAVALVAAAKFGPSGTRGACPGTRAVGHLTLDWPTDYRRANQDVLVFGLIEDVEGVENVEAIANESGLDGLMFGPFDLAQAAGFEGDVTHPDIVRMQTRVRSAASAAGIEYLALAGFEPGGYESIAEYSRIVSVSGDKGALFMAFRSRLDEVTAGLEDATVGATA